MRIAISGTHASGKSTLVAELHHALPRYQVIEEPYYSLLDEGYLFAAEPSVEDFKVQLECSIGSMMENPDRNILFDRCALDFCAYLAVLPGTPPNTIAAWMPSVKDAVRTLDVVVFVPLERPDCIEVSTEEGRGLRKRVNRILCEMLLDDAWGFGVPVLEVSGTPRERVQMVLHHIGMPRSLTS